MLKILPTEIIYEQLLNLPVEDILKVTKYAKDPYDNILWRLLFKRDFPKYPTSTNDWYEEYKRVYKLCQLSKKFGDYIVQEDILQFILDNFSKHQIEIIVDFKLRIFSEVFDGSDLIQSIDEFSMKRRIEPLYELFTIGLDALHFKIDYNVPKIYFKNCQPFVRNVDLFSISLAFNIIEHRIEDFISINGRVDEGNFIVFYAIEGKDPKFDEEFINYLADPNTSLDVVWDRMNEYERKNGSLSTPLLDEITKYWKNKYSDAVNIVSK